MRSLLFIKLWQNGDIDYVRHFLCDAYGDARDFHLCVEMERAQLSHGQLRDLMVCEDYNGTWTR